jgi:hypothetical protein
LPEVGSVDHTLASPLTLLLEEERYGDHQAVDGLFLSFTGDLGFFEAFALGVTQACGARVTVVDDAAVSSYDPRAVRRAGRGYLPGHAACQGAFHPKVVVIAGPARATVAIGSGNLTLAGWQANAELWTVLRGNTDRCPSVLADLARWLRELPEHVRFSWGIPETLARVAGELDALLEKTAERADLGIRLVSTSPGAILDQLPTERVEELAVCAPFHDPGATALRALCDRLQPGRLLVNYQPEYAKIDGPALEALLGGWKGQLTFDAESRYRHGKLIEWVIDGQRYALTGSPNLSSSALLRGVDEGGNCEIGLVSLTGQTLLPDGTAVPLDAVHARRFNLRPRQEGTPLLLGASRVKQGLLVMFARSLPTAGYLELSPAALPPEVWERAADVPSGSTEAMVTIAADGGSRIRLVTTAQNGTQLYSNVVPVVDPERATRRPGITAAHAPSTRADELFDDPRLAERFFADLTTLRTGLPTPPLAMTGGTNRESAARTTSFTGQRDNWERYLDDCAGRIGHPLLRFALGLSLPHDQTQDDFLLRRSWDEQFADDSEAGLDHDDAETVAEDRASEPGTVPPTLPNLRSGVSEQVRSRYRRWAERLTDAADQLGTPERMLVTRLLLWAAAAGAWDHDDGAWVVLLAESLVALGSAELPAEIEPQLASLAAVALSVLRSQAPRYTATEETIAYQAAAKAVAHLLPAATPDYVDEYRQLLDAAFGSAVDPESVQLHAAEVVQADPVADAVWALEEHGRDVHRHGNRLLHVTGRFGNPVLAALEAVGAAQQADLVGAWATSDAGRWALCLWRKPDLLTIDASGRIPLWRHYRLSGLVTPHGLAVQKSFEGAQTIQHGPFAQPFPEATALLDQLDLDSPEPPNDCVRAP